ncbi:MAG: amino acid adenylation domain-containing protein [Acaryochloris sp. CRU_2_0]|nr:amino acid adenylation domain-containing protein [Acaryochloris sp. CRU_2_0]
MNQQANQLAHHLRSLGVNPGARVGLCVERSLAMVVGMVAILKAGGAYVPLDPAYPPERLAFMVQDAQISVLVGQANLLTPFLEHKALQIVVLETGSESLASTTASQENLNNLVTVTTPESLAYIIYTSGSTGKPKGVTVPHRAVNRLVCNTNYIDFQMGDRIAQVSNASFDAATFEVWGALLNGVQLVGIDREVSLSPQSFAEALKTQQITILFLTTALFNQIANQVPDAFKAMRYLLFGGEISNPTLVKRVLEQGAPQALLHVYGPTENTAFTTWYPIQTVTDSTTNLPIGKPIANTQVYILDEQLQLTPMGIPGELYVGGDGLAQGYFQRAEVTAECFIPDPFSDNPLARLYRTGDWVRYRSDGDIEFLERIDHQVKIRGFRIELGEIEAVLSQHPDLKESTVIVREDRPGDKRLVVYYVPQATQQVTPERLRHSLAAKLPDYMVPGFLLPWSVCPLRRMARSIVERYPALPSTQAIAL